MSRAAVIACCAPPVIVALDFAVVSVVAPQLRADLGMSGEQVGWVFSGWSLGFGALLLIAGRMADGYGRRRMLVAGLAVFGAGAIALTAAPTAAAAVGARVVQGAGAALMTPAALAMLTSATREGAERGRVTAAYGLAIATGFVVGTLASGVLATLADWRLAAALAAPLCVVAAVAVRRVPSAPRSGAEMVVGRGRALFVAALVATAALGATVDGWPGIAAPVAATTALLLVAAGLGRATTGRRRPLTTACAAGLVVTATGVAATLLLTLFLQDVRGLSPLETGWAFACFGVAAVPGARAARAIAARRRPGVLVGAGLAAQGAALVAAAAAVAGGSGLAVLLCLAGFGFGHVIGNASVAAVATANAREAVHGVLAGMLATAQYLGGALGPALVTPAAGFTTGIAACGAAALAAAAAAWAVLQGD